MTKRTQVFIDGERACPRCEVRKKVPNGKYCRECRNAYSNARRKLGVYTEKHYARAMAKEYERRGYLVRPDACQICDSKSILERHHTDYSKPLDIVWLCRPCHRAVDAGTVVCPAAIPFRPLRVNGFSQSRFRDAEWERKWGNP